MPRRNRLGSRRGWDVGFDVYLPSVIDPVGLLPRRAGAAVLPVTDTAQFVRRAVEGGRPRVPRAPEIDLPRRSQPTAPRTASAPAKPKPPRPGPPASSTASAKVKGSSVLATTVFSVREAAQRLGLVL